MSPSFFTAQSSDRPVHPCRQDWGGSLAIKSSCCQPYLPDRALLCFSRSFQPNAILNPTSRFLSKECLLYSNICVSRYATRWAAYCPPMQGIRLASWICSYKKRFSTSCVEPFVAEPNERGARKQARYLT